MLMAVHSSLARWKMLKAPIASDIDLQRREEEPEDVGCGVFLLTDP
jgi:hypothetical protein